MGYLAGALFRDRSIMLGIPHAHPATQLPAAAGSLQTRVCRVLSTICRTKGQENNPSRGHKSAVHLYARKHFSVAEIKRIIILIDLSYRAEVRSSFITTTVRDESQVTPQGRHW